jgi:hypothetical protein
VDDKEGLLACSRLRQTEFCSGFKSDVGAQHESGCIMPAYGTLLGSLGIRLYSRVVPDPAEHESEPHWAAQVLSFKNALPREISFSC